MKDRPDVVIIGGGVIGVCTAYYLSKRGADVTLIEKGDICSGSSYGNAGLVAPSQSMPLAKPGVISQGLKWLLDPESPFYIKPRLSTELFLWLWQFYRASVDKERFLGAMKLINKLKLESLKRFNEISPALSDTNIFDRKGMFLACRSEHGFRSALNDYEKLRPLGLEFEVVQGGSLKNIVPDMEMTIHGGLFFPRDAHIIPHRFVKDLAQICKSNGAQIRTLTEVLGFDQQNGTITVIKTDRGDLEAEEIVIAGGAWSAGIAKHLNYNVPIQPAKGYSLTFPRPPNVPDFPVFLSESKIIVTPMSDTLRIGGTLELTGLDHSVNRRRVAAMVKNVSDYLPRITIPEHCVQDAWCGLRPLTPDGLPVLGRLNNFTNVTIATGHGMFGMALGPITGVIPAQITTHEKPAIDIGLLDINRFQSSSGSVTNI